MKMGLRTTSLLICGTIAALLAAGTSATLAADACTTRDYHYVFAHKALPSLLFERREALMRTLENRGQDFVHALWASVLKTVRPAECPPPDDTGLSFSKEIADGATVYLIGLPAPAALAEAHYVAVVEKDQAVRYFTLELTGASSRCDGATILGEWTKDGGHRNYGCGPRPERGEFVKAVLARF